MGRKEVTGKSSPAEIVPLDHPATVLACHEYVYANDQWKSYVKKIVRNNCSVVDDFLCAAQSWKAVGQVKATELRDKRVTHMR